jgi:hypothetical protein
MVKSYARFLLAFAAFLLAVGAIMHASAFKKIASTAANSNLEAFAAGSLNCINSSSHSGFPIGRV